ncbi:S-adenosylmethionine synthase [Venturia inaequalis]|nr:S-adenosylmethionine synthase [Venturia inaequalis]
MYITLETRKIDHNSRDGEATDSTTVATQDAQAMRAEALRQIELLPFVRVPRIIIRILLHDNLTEDQAKEKVFAFTDISKYVEEMNDNPARRSEFYYTKFFHLRAHLGGNHAVHKEWVSEAQKAYQRVFSAYASDGKVEIDKMGNELNKLRQDLDPNQ